MLQVRRSNYVGAIAVLSSTLLALGACSEKTELETDEAVQITAELPPMEPEPDSAPLPEFCSAKDSERRVIRNRHWGDVRRCNEDLAVTINAYPDPLSKGAGGSAAVYFTSPECRLSGDKAHTYEFPEQFFDLPRVEQPGRALILIREAFEEFSEECKGKGDVEALLDDRMRADIAELSQFWHWSREQKDIYMCIVETSRPDDCVKRHGGTD